MNRRITNHRSWRWIIPSTGGTFDEIDLFLGVFGQEKITVDGKIISKKNSYRQSNEYTVALSDGRFAHLRIAADWKNFGLPVCNLQICGETIPPVFSPTTPIPAELARTPPPLSNSRRNAVIIFELWKMLFIGGILGWLFVIGLRMADQRLIRSSVLLIFLIFFGAKIGTKWIKTIRLAKKDGLTVAEVIYRENFDHFERARLTGPPIGQKKSSPSIYSKTKMALSAVMFLVGCAVIASGVLRGLSPVFYGHKLTTESVALIYTLGSPLVFFKAYLYD